jgi:hypothetical protein
MLELVLAAGSMSLQIALAAMGIRLALRSPASATRRLRVLAFILCGALGVALTGLATVYTATLGSAAAARIDELDRENGALKKRLTAYVRPARTLTAEQQEALPRLLRQAGECELGIRHSEGHAESKEFAGALAMLLQQAGWKLRWPEPLVQDKEAPGVWVMVHSQQDAPLCAKMLLTSLKAVGIEASGVEVHAMRPGTFDLLVGVP